MDTTSVNVTPTVQDTLLSGDSKAPSLYKALEADEIRVLYLWPSENFDAPLDGFFVVQRPSTEPYKALSYAWGDPAPTDVLFVDGYPCGIAANLAAGLRRLRPATEMLTIWVDAICIKQDDMVERSEQVRHMHRIYAGAEEVIVWLGAPADDSDRAILFIKTAAAAFKLSGFATCWKDFIQQVDGMSHSPQACRDTNAHVYRVEKTFQTLTTSTTTQHPREGISAGYNNHLDQRNWQAVNHLLARSWWQRLWILQEIAHARSAVLRCGTASMVWDDLYAVVVLAELANKLYNTLGPCLTANCIPVVRPLLDFFDGKSIQRYYYTPLALFSMAQSRPCSDPRDKVFFLPGLTGRDNIVHVDYTKSVQDVYRDFAKDQIMYWTPSLHIFRLAGVGWTSTISDMPSWVPDWHMNHSKHGLAEELYSAAKHFIRPSSEHPDGDRLGVLGLSVDSVDIVECQVQYSDGKCPSFELLNPHCGLYRTRSSNFHALVRCRLHDKMQRRAKSGRSSSFGQSGQVELENTMRCALLCLRFDAATDDDDGMGKFRQWKQSSGVGDTDPISRSQHFDLGDIPESLQMGSVFPWSLEVRTSSANAISGWFEHHVSLRSSVSESVAQWRGLVGRDREHRRLFRPKNGYFGSEPLFMQPGDLVCILFGGRVPYLLRKRANAEGYILVGTVYVHGIMDGEVLDELGVTSLDDPHVTKFNIY